VIKTGRPTLLPPLDLGYGTVKAVAGDDISLGDIIWTRVSESFAGVDMVEVLNLFDRSGFGG
jgi:hypothetical protein